MAGDSGARYYDIRHVTGKVTHIDIDNGVIESAGASLFDHAVVRVLGPRGWGIITLDNYQWPRGKKFDELIKSGLRLAILTGEEVELAPAAHGMLSVPPLKEDPAGVSMEEKSELLGGIGKSASLPGIVNTRANYIERRENVRFLDSTGQEYDYSTCRSGFSILAVAQRNGMVQMGYEREHTIRGFDLRHKEESGHAAATRALQLLEARPAQGGKMNAILDPELAVT
jgi:TldD protein